MTAVSYQRQLESKSQQSSPHQPRRNRRWILPTAAVACSLLAGMAAMAHAYQIGEYHLSTPSEFMWFWAGMLLLTLPLIGLMARRGTSRTLRTALLTLYGIVTYAPKLLRNPFSPLYYDEFAHWRATEEILRTGKLFNQDPIVSIAARYPGLHAATAALVNATGLTIWQAATVLLLLCHALLTLGIAALAEGLGVTSRTASLAAVLYSLNSSFLYFDTQFAYESMAVTLVVWTLVAYVRAISSRSTRERAASCFMTVLLSAGTVITHHLSTFTLVLIMAVIALGLSIPWLARAERWVRAAATAWALTLAVTLMAGFWFFVVAPGTISYLSPYFGQGLSQLMEDAQGTGTAKQVFSASLSPWWEQRSAYLVVMLAFAMAVGGLLFLRSRMKHRRIQRGPLRALVLGFAALGILYFPSTLFILSSAGAEGARRSWAFTWIGLAVLAAPLAGLLLDLASRPIARWARVSLRIGLTIATALAMIGGTAAGLDASYRFPGPFLYGSDTRDITPELLAASAWFRARFGTGNNIVTDRYTGVIFASYGLQNTAATYSSFPTYELFLAKPGSPVMSSLLAKLKSGDYDYVIVDRRMAYHLPEVGVYFDPGEPNSLVPASGKSPFYGKLQEFNSLSWMVKIFQSDNYSIYRLDLPVTKIVYGSKPPAGLGKLVVTP